MSNGSNYDRIIRSLPSHHTSRSAAFRSLFEKGEFTIDLYTVDRLLQQNDHELCVEVVNLMLDYLNCENREEIYPAGCAASYQAIINRLGINKGAIEIDHEYLVPLLALLPDGGLTAAGFPCRKELADFVHVLRQRTDWTSATFTEAFRSSTWQSSYTDLSELYAISIASDIRIESLHYGKLFEILFFRQKEGVNVVVVAEDNADGEEKNNDEDAEEDKDEDNEEKIQDEDVEGAEDDQDEDNEAEIDVIDPISEDVTSFDYIESLNEFLSWLGLKNSSTTTTLMLSNQAPQISQFLGMSYYHAVSAVLGVVFSLIQKYQRHLNFRIIYMFHEFFFTHSFPIPEIISSYEAPLLKDITSSRQEQLFMLSYERRMREMGTYNPNEGDHDIGITRRVGTLPFLSETRLMFISSMMEASVFNGGTHFNATSGFQQYLEEKRGEFAQLQEERDNAEENGEEFDELQEQLDELAPTVEVCERFCALLERFHEAMYEIFNTKFSSYTCIIVAWVIAKCDNDQSSIDIIEKYFGVNEENWNDYDAELYYESLKKTGDSAKDAIGLDFSWAKDDYCMELENSRVLLYNLSKPCSDYDDLLYRIIAQLAAIDHTAGIDWVMDKLGKSSLQDVTNTVLYGRLSLFSFATQLDECSLNTSKFLVKRKAKVVVNNSFSEASNIFVSIFCSPHLSDDQVYQLFDYWYKFCERNSKNNKMSVNIFELYTILNRAWAFRYSRAGRVNSLQLFAEKILSPSSLEQMCTSTQPNFLQILFSTLTSQSNYSDVSPNGNTSSRYGDFACISYEQELLGLFYKILFPTIGHFAKSLQLFQTPASIFAPIFVHQSKKAFDHIFFELKFPVRIEILVVMINSMLPSVDWSSCVDVQSIVLQYQRYLELEKSKSKKKKGKKGAKKGSKKSTPAEIQVVIGDDEKTPAEPIGLTQNAAVSIDKSSPGLETTESQFFSFTNATILSSLRKLELNTTVQYNSLIQESLQGNVKAQQAFVNDLNSKILTAYGSEAVSMGVKSDNVEQFNKAIAVRDENKHTIEFFNDDKNKSTVDGQLFNTFNQHILSKFKPDFYNLTETKSGKKLEQNESIEIESQFEDLFRTIISPLKHPEIPPRFDNIELDTTVLDALIWFVDENEKAMEKEYNGCELTYGFVLYALAALLTLFIQVNQQTVSQTDQDNESISHQLAQLYIALNSSLSTAQGTPIYQTLQLLLKSTNPLPSAYQHSLIRITNDQLRHFYNPWVQSLYSHYAQTRMLGQLALDLEVCVQESSQGKKILVDENNDNSRINALLKWTSEGITVEYTPTILFQAVLSAIITESICQSYMIAFQQHYPQRIQYMQSLMRAQYQRREQASPYCTHTYKFTGLAQLNHFVSLFDQIGFIPDQITYVLFTLFPALDITTTLAASPDLENIQSLWKFYAIQRLKLFPKEKLSFLTNGTHPAWMIDIWDKIFSKSKSKSKNDAYLSFLSNLAVPQQDVLTTAYNPLYGPVISYSQIIAPITQLNEMLTMNYWAQLSHTFGSLVAHPEQFFLLSEKIETPHDNKEAFFGQVGGFDDKNQFLLISPDPLMIDGYVKLYNKYIKEKSNGEFNFEKFKTIFETNLSQSTMIIAKQEIEQEFIEQNVTEETLTKFDINNVILGIEPPPPAVVVPEKPKPFGFSTANMIPSTDTNPLMAANKKKAEKKDENKIVEKGENEKDEKKINEQHEQVQILASPESKEDNVNSGGGSSAVSTILTAGAVVGIIGAAIYAGLTYFQNKTNNQQNEEYYDEQE
jgi:hypothetical protein